MRAEEAEYYYLTLSQDLACHEAELFYLSNFFFFSIFRGWSFEFLSLDNDLIIDMHM